MALTIKTFAGALDKDETVEGMVQRVNDQANAYLEQLPRIIEEKTKITPLT